MNPRRPIEIVGGGLAGLSLGAALARAGVAVTVFEAGSYPRHRVCGEFIAGLDERTRQRLGLDAVLAGAEVHATVAWFDRGRPAGGHELARTALGISRHVLDARLAAGFVAAGGHLILNTRCEPAGSGEGRVFASGRQVRKSRGVGLKMHVRGLELAADLELHLGKGCYVGLCGVGAETVNICGLFDRAQVRGGGGERVLIDAVRRAGLGALAERIHGAEVEAESCVAVAGLAFEREERADGLLRIGDSRNAIPPFSGSGMALAFQSAAAALEPLLAWAEGRCGWSEAVATARMDFKETTRRRFWAARCFHPWLLSPGRQRVLAMAQRRRWLPMTLCSRLLHT